MPDDLGSFGIVTNSPVREIEGSTVWLIKGKGSPKKYSLCYQFIAEGVESGEEHGFKHRVYGSKGSWHKPAIELNSMAWFPDFRKAQGNFAFGLSPINQPEVVSGLLKLVGSSPASPSAIPDNDKEDLESMVRASMRLSSAERSARLAKAPRIPERREVVAYEFKRNPDVIAAVLIRANGKCEKCHKPAPFVKDSDGTPYLEVHHWKPLSQGGEDTVENAGALCPNCHREEHFGKTTP